MAARTKAPRRRVGDTRTPLYATIKQRDNDDASAVLNLTGLTVKFMMINSATGVTKIAETSTGVTVETAASGTVKYDFSSTGCDDAGIFWGSFVVYDSTETDHAPAEMNGYEILIDSDTQTAEEAYAAALEA
jgi:hypothetical protein